MQNFSFYFIIFLFILSATEISKKTLSQKEVKQILQRERTWAARFLHGRATLCGKYKIVRSAGLWETMKGLGYFSNKERLKELVLSSLEKRRPINAYKYLKGPFYHIWKQIKGYVLTIIGD